MIESSDSFGTQTDEESNMNASERRRGLPLVLVALALSFAFLALGSETKSANLNQSRSRMTSRSVTPDDPRIREYGVISVSALPPTAGPDTNILITVTIEHANPNSDVIVTLTNNDQNQFSQWISTAVVPKNKTSAQTTVRTAHYTSGSAVRITASNPEGTVTTTLQVTGSVLDDN
jgi:hypothetical protein